MAGQFLASSFLYFFFSQPETWVCPTGSRNLTCTQENAPVCSLFACGTSPNGYCERTHSNPCQACSDPTVAGYVAGGCGSNPVRVCSAYEQNAGCEMQVPGPYCGLSVLGTQFELNKTSFEPSCAACNTTGVEFSIAGRTQEQCQLTSSQTICRPADRNRTDCPADGQPACAYYKQGCTEPLCHRDEPSGCQACAADGILFYTEGPCDTEAPVVPVVAEVANNEEAILEEEGVFGDAEGRLLFQDDYEPSFGDFIW